MRTSIAVLVSKAEEKEPLKEQVPPAPVATSPPTPEPEEIIPLVVLDTDDSEE